MAIRCEHVHRLELRKSFKFWATVERSKCPKTPVISYPSISYFRHACPKLNFVLIYRLTGNCAAHNFENNSSL